MKLARILLASAAVALLAACGNDPVGPSGAADGIKPRHSITADSTTTYDTVSGDGTSYDTDASLTCVDTTVVVAGVNTVVRVCDGRGPAMGTGT